MSPVLTPAEWQELSSEYSLAMHESTLPLVQSVRASELLDTERCGRYLDWLALYIGAPSRRVAASMLAKRYAFVAVVPALHAMSWFDKGLRLLPGQCRLVSPDYGSGEHGKTRFPLLTLGEAPITAPAAAGREQWRDQVLSELFAGHVSPFFRALAEAGQVPMAILWENAYVRIAPLYEEEGIGDPQIREDYVYIVNQAPASLFGERRNPFKAFAGAAVGAMSAMSTASGMSTIPAASGPQMRKTCCLYYEMAPEYCRKCPKTPRQSN